MTEETTQPANPEPYDDEPIGLGFSITRTQAIVALGVFGVCAVMLAMLRTRVSRATVALDAMYMPEASGDWQESMAHFTRAIDLRTQGMEDRLDNLEAGMRRLLGEPEPRLAVPIPSPAESSDDLDTPVVGVAQHPPVGAEEPPPPGPASVSM